MESILSKPDIDFKDDFRQAFIVAKYEIMKFMSGKKILIFGIINALVLAILTIVIFAVKIENLDTCTLLSTKGIPDPGWMCGDPSL